ncbi:MAG: CHAT domain-containing protein, partial [Candidatus Riflebacteria bacterium]|nr:CHAT domain-containing protein [Candidatus Riflebacteria bacterium]
YPYPIASVFHKVRIEDSQSSKRIYLFATVKHLLQVLTTLGIQQYSSILPQVSPKDREKVDPRVLSFLRGAPSLGHWQDTLREICRVLGHVQSSAARDGRPDPLFVPELPGFYFKPGKDKVTEFEQLVNDFVSERNDLEHSPLPRPDPIERQTVERVTPDIRKLLRGAEFLTRYPMAYLVNVHWKPTHAVFKLSGKLKSLAGPTMEVPSKPVEFSTCEGEEDVFLLRRVMTQEGGVARARTREFLCLRPFWAVRVCARCSKLHLFAYDGVSDGVPQYKAYLEDHQCSGTELENSDALLEAFHTLLDTLTGKVSDASCTARSAVLTSDPTEAALAELFPTTPRRVTSRPEGAAVFLDGQEVGTTPCDVLPPRSGSGRLAVRKPGYGDQELAFSAEDQGEVSLLLVPSVKLHVASEPAGCEVWLGDGLLGLAPSQFTLEREGEVELRLVHAGYLERRVMVTLVTGEPASVKVALEPARGRLHVTSEPSDASVWLDDREVGVTPYVAMVDATDRLRIRVLKAGYVESERTVSLAPGGSRAERFVLDARPADPMGKIRYEDFLVNIAPMKEQPGLYIVQVAHRGTQEFRPVDLSAILSQAPDLRRNLAASVRRDLGVRPAQGPAVPLTGRDLRDFGGRLFDAVFAEQVGLCLQSAVMTSRSMGQKLRLRLCVAPGLAELPWELLYRRTDGSFLALSTDNPLVRSLNTRQPVQAVAVEPPLRMLVVIASPEGPPSLDVQAEEERIRQALELQSDLGAITLEFIRGPDTYSQLHHRLAGPPGSHGVHILHFIGHGAYDTYDGEGVLVGEDPQRQPRVLSAQVLKELLRLHASLRLVVLNSCDGARSEAGDLFAGVAAKLVAGGVPAVVAMQNEVTDKTAVSFTQGFYTAVARGDPVDEAMTSARLEIKAARHGSFEWCTPVLFLNAPDGELFTVRPLSVEVLTRRFVELWNQNKHERSIRCLQVSLAREPRNPRLLQVRDKVLGAWPRVASQKAEQALQANDPARALALAEQVLDLCPADPVAPGLRERARLALEVANLRGSGQAAVDEQRWKDAEEALLRLLRLSPHDEAASRLLTRAQGMLRIGDLYRQAMQALAEHRWSDCMRLLAEVQAIEPTYRDVPEQSRRAEVGCQADSLHVAGKEAYSAGRYEEAVQHFRELRSLAPEFPDAEDWLQRAEEARDQETALVRLQEVLARLGRQSLVRNPLVLCEGTDAYELLSVVGISPRSSMNELLECSELLMERGLRSPEVRLARDRLRLVPSRLKVDFFHHEGPEPERLAALARRAVGAHQVPSDEDLAEELGRDAGLVVLTQGFRKRTAALWERLRRSSPELVEVSHDLGLFHFGWAESLESRGELARAAESWRAAIAHLSHVLAMPGWTKRWRQAREEVYQQHISRDCWLELTVEIERLLRQRWSSWAEHHQTAGRPDRIALYADLANDWLAERRGAQLLKQAGGLRRSKDDAHPLTGGYLYVTRMGLEDCLARLVAKASSDADDELDAAGYDALLAPEDDEAFGRQPNPEALQDLRRYFSNLRRPAAYLEQGNPREALTALEHLACERCAPALPPAGDRAPAARGPLEPPTCGNGCPEFNRLNPAYRRLEGRHAEFRADARRLAVEVRMALAVAELGSASCDAGLLFTLWREAFSLAKNLDQVDQVQDAIRELTLGRATVLDRDTGNWVRSFTQAIDLLDRTLKEFGDTGERHLASKLAEVLTDRAVSLANQHQLHEQALADLRRAFALTSHSPRTRDNLCCALIHTAMELNSAGRRDIAKDNLEEADRLLREGQDLHPAYPGFAGTLQWLQRTWEKIDPSRRRTLEDVLAEIDRAIGASPQGATQHEESSRLCTAGIAKIGEGDLEAGIEDLRAALQRDPINGTAENALIDALVRLGHDCAMAMDYQRGLAVLEAAVKEFPDRQSLQTQLEVLRVLADAGDTSNQEAN